MCDLWKNTLPDNTPTGAIIQQLDAALPRLLANDPRPRQVKLYNSGSFFDAGAIAPSEHAAIAERLRPFERVIVECHPALIGDSAWRFRDRLAGRLEVAMGLETAHPEVLARLNKRMTLEQFAQAASRLQAEQIALRAFVLVKPPFLNEAEARHWGERSIDFALDCQATVTALIPTRLGNGALDALAGTGEFSIPDLATLEAVAEYGVGLGRARVFADLWELAVFSKCTDCFEARRARLHRINLRQTLEAAVRCSRCSAT
jgi:radical SAM enzyme (TIGR01210 family)